VDVYLRRLRAAEGQQRGQRQSRDQTDQAESFRARVAAATAASRSDARTPVARSTALGRDGKVPVRARRTTPTTVITSRLGARWQTLIGPIAAAFSEGR
jgi:hypothetical protein